MIMSASIPSSLKASYTHVPSSRPEYPQGTAKASYHMSRPVAVYHQGGQLPYVRIPSRHCQGQLPTCLCTLKQASHHMLSSYQSRPATPHMPSLQAPGNLPCVRVPSREGTTCTYHVKASYPRPHVLCPLKAWQCTLNTSYSHVPSRQAQSVPQGCTNLLQGTSRPATHLTVTCSGTCGGTHPHVGMQGVCITIICMQGHLDVGAGLGNGY